MAPELEIDQTVDHHIEEFADWLSLGKRTKENYTSSVRRFYHLSGRDTPVDPAGITDEQQSLLADDLIQYITSESMKYAMKKYLTWLQQRAPTSADERAILFLQNKVENKDPDTTHSDIGAKVLSPNKVQELCIKTPERMRTGQEEARLLLQMMYDTATRISGMLWLEWQDVWREEYEGETLDENEQFIHHDRSKSKDSGVVELSNDTVRRLREHEERITPTDPESKVFFRDLKENSAYKKIYRNFTNQAKEIGVPDASPHWFRHSRLTHLGLEMRDDGKSYAEIKERLRKYGRHRSGETTEIYIKILKNRKAESVQKYSTISW